MMRLCSEG